MATEIGAYEAKTKLPELLREVAEGRRFTITHRGKPVADLVPSGASTIVSAGDAVDDMLKFDRVENVSADDLTEWIAEGRR